MNTSAVMSTSSPSISTMGQGPHQQQQQQQQQDQAIQLKTLNAHLSVLVDTGSKDELKLKAAQELSDNFDLILASPHYQHFLENSMRVFLKVRQPHYSNK